MPRHEKNATHCPRGHERTPENIDTYSRCKICVKEAQKRINKSSRCTKCGARNYSTTGREICAKCHKESAVWENKALQKFMHDEDEPEFTYEKRAKKMTDDEVVIHLKDFMRTIVDLGDSSVPIHYVPGSPEFIEIARLYA